jgi:hypothetical protein
MKTKGRIKPSKPVAFGQMVGSAVFAVIGLTVIIPLMREDDGPVWFGVIWTLLALVGAVTSAYNFFSEEGIATEEFSYTSEGQTQIPERSIEIRLRELKKLKEQGLIRADEYESKRSDLLNQI